MRDDSNHRTHHTGARQIQRPTTSINRHPFRPGSNRQSSLLHELLKLRHPVFRAGIALFQDVEHMHCLSELNARTVTLDRG